MPSPLPDPDREPRSAPAAVLQALARLLRPVVRLLIACGVPFQAANEALKRAYVEAGRRHFRDQATSDSRLSLLTGLNRKEVRRLTTASADEWGPESVTSFAAAVFTAWSLRPEWRGEDGRPRPLPRRGEGSFDTLARAITQDHHPAAVLEELVRLRCVRSLDGDRVTLEGDAFLSSRDFRDRLGPLVENVEDHLDAAVTNVLADAPPFLERSLFADELSPESARLLQEAAREEWKRLHDTLITRADALEAADRASGAAGRVRVRIGLYAFGEERGPPEPSDGSPGQAP